MSLLYGFVPCASSGYRCKSYQGDETSTSCIPSPSKRPCIEGVDLSELIDAFRR